LAGSSSPDDADDAPEEVAEPAGDGERLPLLPVPLLLPSAGSLRLRLRLRFFLLDEAGEAEGLRPRLLEETEAEAEADGDRDRAISSLSVVAWWCGGACGGVLVRGG